MNEVIDFPALPGNAQVMGEAQLREQIRRSLATVCGVYLKSPDALQVLDAMHQLDTAIALIRAHWAITQGREQ